jgi:hypothetical protein
MEDTDGNGGPDGRRPKVARLIEAYGLDGLGAELEHRWTAEGEDRWSLRDLADHFNRRLLEAALADADVRTLDGEPANVYRLLTDDEVSDADRTRTRRRLERDGVDVDGLLDSFVSYQAVRTYLREYRDAEYAEPEGDRLATERENLQRLQGRTESVTEGKVQQLRRGGHLEVGSVRTLVEVAVVCEDCGARYEISTLLDRGHCDCDGQP